ncbi:MAG: hypothetical protein NTY19_43900 [Planctomycetota bacterium]|nr:hypothetical protein [Planctomycetota bacterium]
MNAELLCQLFADHDVGFGAADPRLESDRRREGKGFARQGRGCGPPGQRDRALDELPGTTGLLLVATGEGLGGQGRFDFVLIEFEHWVAPTLELSFPALGKVDHCSLIVSAEMSLRI